MGEVIAEVRGSLPVVSKLSTPLQLPEACKAGAGGGVFPRSGWSEGGPEELTGSVLTGLRLRQQALSWGVQEAAGGPLLRHLRR